MRKFGLFITLLCILIANLIKAQSFEKAVVSNLSIVNSAKLDFSPTFHKDGIVFISNGTNISGKLKMQDKKINQKGLSILIAKRDDRGVLQEPQPFAYELVTHVHDGPLTFSDDCKTVYFSRNNNRRTGGFPKYVTFIDRMQIYKSQLTDKGWSRPKRIFFDVENKDYCHPALSPDGKKLYFASNRKGGYGGMDLYVCNISEKGKLSKPVNLGPNVNSDKDDAFPFVHQNGTLYFASNKAGGKGGYDIYYTSQAAGSKDFSTPLSIDAPFNSENDDFGFIINPELKMGYFSSNRNGGEGEDDIYTFVIEEKPETPQNKPVPVVLSFLDRKTQEPIPNSEVIISLENSSSKGSQKFMTDDKGQVVFKHNPMFSYNIKITNNDYKEEGFKLEKSDTRPEITILADKIVIEKPIENKTDVVSTETTAPKVETPVTKPEENKTVSTATPSVPVAKPKENPIVSTPGLPAPIPVNIDKSMSNSSNDTFFKVNKIFYDFDKFNIRKDASQTLDEMVVMMNQYPDLMIEVEAHTDSRGSHDYNKKLSERRAVSVEQYLVKHGISSDRIKHVARGKSMLINDCVKCSENVHQANRRAEIRIVKYGK